MSVYLFKQTVVQEKEMQRTFYSLTWIKYYTKEGDNLIIKIAKFECFLSLTVVLTCGSFL